MWDRGRHSSISMRRVSGPKLTEMVVFGMGMGRRPKVLERMVAELEGRNTALRGLGISGFFFFIHRV